MKDWLIEILIQSQSDNFTGRIRSHFGSGKVQHVVRTTTNVDSPDDSTLPPPDPGDIIDLWMLGGRTGHIDFYFLAGTLTDVEASDTLFPPKGPARDTTVKCPICPQGHNMKHAGDYGNTLQCPSCKWKGTLTEITRKERERGGSQT
jgi:hypothetical protein